VKAHVKVIMDLPTITSSNPKKIHGFSDRLTHAVHGLETLTKLETVNGYVPMTLDKLSGICGDLGRTDPDWESWNFAKLSEAVRLWTQRNLCGEYKEDDLQLGRRDMKLRKLMHSKGFNGKQQVCVYCDGTHKANECDKVTDVSTRKQILAEKRLCFNCATGNHRATLCPSKITCQKCKRKYHTSICNMPNEDQTLLTMGKTNKEGIFPVVLVKVNGIKCQVLIDSGAGSSYASAKLLDTLKLKPVQTKTRRIDMLMTSRTARLEIYNANVQALDSD
jgi:hypothetical protein